MTKNKLLLTTSALLCGVALAAGCEPAPASTVKPAAKASPARVGAVVKRVGNPGGVYLVITTKKPGETRNVEVSRRTFGRCTKGETYPKCANR